MTPVTNQPKTEPSRTVLTIATGFLIIHLLTGGSWALYIALGTGIIGVVSSAASRLIDRLWMKLAVLLSRIVPNILLTVVFYLVMVPLSLLMRLFSSGDPMDLKNRRQSMFRETDKTFPAESFTKPW